MTKPIKFRGRVPVSDEHHGGKIVFGSLVIYSEDEAYCQGYPCWIVPPKDYRSYPVETDSVAQLVGVDKDGNEVYEDDLVTDKNGYDGFAALLPVVDDVFVTDVGCCSCFNDKCKLKEARP